MVKESKTALDFGFQGFDPMFDSLIPDPDALYRYRPMHGFQIRIPDFDKWIPDFDKWIPVKNTSIPIDHISDI